MASLHVPIVAENVVQGTRIVLVDLRTQKDSQPRAFSIIIIYYYSIIHLIIPHINMQATLMLKEGYSPGQDSSR